MMPFVTYDNFWDEVKLYCLGQPKKAEGLGCIVTKIDSPEAEAWIQYANDKGWPGRAKYFAKMLKQGNALTMPCADPRKFDREYRGSERQTYRDEPRAERRADARSIAEQVREAAKKARPPNERRRKDWKPEPPKPPTLAEIEAAARHTPPPPFSPTLRAHLGIGDEEGRG